MTSNLEIFWGSGSPNAWRVLLTAEVKKIPYESRLIDFSRKDHRKPEFIAMNPRGKVPVIRDGNEVLYESLAIMAYLDRRYPNPPLFGDTAGEVGRISRALSEFECYLKPALLALVTALARQPYEQKQVRELAEDVHQELWRLEQSLDSGDWLCGAGLSAADLAVYPFLKFLERIAGKDESKPLGLGLLPFEAKYPRIGAWMSLLETLPGYARTYPPHWR